MDQNKDQKIQKIQKIKSDFFSFLNSAVKNRNKKIEEVIRKQDDKKIKDILNNIK